MGTFLIWWAETDGQFKAPPEVRDAKSVSPSLHGHLPDMVGRDRRTVESPTGSEGRKERLTFLTWAPSLYGGQRQTDS